MSEVTMVTCNVKKDLFKALDKLNVRSKKAFCEAAIESAIHAKVEDVASKDDMISKFIEV